MLIYVVAELFQQQTDTKGVIFKIQVKPETELWIVVYVSVLSVLIVFDPNPKPKVRARFIVKELLQFLIGLTDDFHLENRSNLVKLIYY